MHQRRRGEQIFTNATKGGEHSCPGCSHPPDGTKRPGSNAGKHMILPKPECPHGQLIENRSTPDAQIRILEFMYLSKYHPSHHLHSVESAPKSYSRSPLGVLDHSHPHTGHGPTLVMALMQTAFLADVCSPPCASVTQIMQRARWLLYIIAHELSWH